MTIQSMPDDAASLRPGMRVAPPICMAQAGVSHAAAFGVLGALLMSLTSGVELWLGWLSIGMENLLGQFITGQTGPSSWLAGFVWHLLNGAVFGISYSMVFRVLGSRSATTGGVIAFFHWMIAGLFLAFSLGPKNPIYWSVFGTPLFLTSLPIHIIFGGVVGALEGGRVRNAQVRQIIARTQRAA